MLADDYHEERALPPFQQPGEERCYIYGHGKYTNNQRIIAFN